MGEKDIKQIIANVKCCGGEAQAVMEMEHGGHFQVCGNQCIWGGSWYTESFPEVLSLRQKPGGSRVVSTVPLVFSSELQNMPFT